MEIKLYKNFNKRANSTKRPSVEGDTVNVYLKNGTSIENPTFVINGIDTDYNYAYAFGHYYFIRDLILVSNDNFEIVCEQDLLATYRNEIGASTQYIARSASQSDGAIRDDMYPMSNDTTGSYSSISSFKVSPSSGCYVLGVVGNNSSCITMGGVSYYVLSQDGLENFSRSLFSSDVWSSLKSSYDRPEQFITSCVWLPIARGNISSDSTVQIMIGNVGSGSYAYPLTAFTSTLSSGVITVPKHPQANRGKFLYSAPYSQYWFVIPCFGVIPIDSADIVEASNIVASIKIDTITGKGYLRVLASLGGAGTPVIQTNGGMVGVPISLGIARNWGASEVIGVATSAIGTGVSIATGNIVGALSGIGGMIGSFANGSAQKGGAVGANGSFILSNEDSYFCYKFTYIADEYNAVYGRPLCKSATINSLSGFIQCANASISIGGLGNDKDIINNYLNGGFYYE